MKTETLKLRVRGPISLGWTSASTVWCCRDPRYPSMLSYGATPQEAIEGHLDLMGAIAEWSQSR